MTEPPRRSGLTAYLAPPGFVDRLVRELRGVEAVHDRLVLARGPAQRALWVRNVWIEPVLLGIESIADGARALRSLGREWALYSIGHHRRAHLIEERLPKPRFRPLPFPGPRPIPPGSWTLLHRDTILAAPRCSSPFPHGIARFVEDRAGPPSRAYLKLWEALLLRQRWPQPDERCLDAGASPGGWTWALARLGAQVTAVDRAPLAARVAALPNVAFVRASAFSLPPAQLGRVDWLFSDVACYPRRLLAWIERWLASGRCHNYVCTVKLQGSSPEPALAGFSSLSGGVLLHLSRNQHEVTWIRTGAEGGAGGEGGAGD